MNQFVLDASIALTWCFPDENTALAEYVASLFAHGATAIVPSFWPHEVLNALLVGEKRKRISQENIQSFLNDLAMLPIVLQQSPAGIVFSRIQSLSRQHRITAYDAAYLDLALDRNLPLATLDDDLIAACKDAQAELIQIQP